MVQEHRKQTETQIVNSLDVTLTCNNGSFNFYHKPDDIIQYTNKESNHYPSIIKHLPASIEKRLSNISSDEKILTEAAIYYENTLNNASYTNKLVYHTPSASNQENKNKNHHIVSVTMRIGQSFLYLLDAHFPKNHIFNKIFNRNKLKVSYSIQQHAKHQGNH